MLWFGHIALTWFHFGQWTLWSVAPDIPMMLLLAPTCVPWSVQKDWWLYSLLYKVPHSFWFVLFFVPFEHKKVYAFHILCDILSHTGEWSIQPLYPLPLKIHGIWDPVQWE